MSIAPLAAPPIPVIESRQPPDVTAFVELAAIEADLWTPGRLPGETLAEARARRDAAADILDDLLAEIAAARAF